jgi:hypothetical protein
MTLLKKAGIDLSQPDTVFAIVGQLDGLVSRLENEIEALGPAIPSSRGPDTAS